MSKRIDFTIDTSKRFRNKAIRTIYFGGERIRKLLIWNDSIGNVDAVSVEYSEEKTKK